jgi:hypothetical protein
VAGNTFFVEDGFNLCIVIYLFRAARKIPDQTANYYQSKYDKKSFYMKHRLQQRL